MGGTKLVENTLTGSPNFLISGCKSSAVWRHAGSILNGLTAACVPIVQDMGFSSADKKSQVPKI